MIALAILCTTVSFRVGMQTSADVRAVDRTQAGDVLLGDINNDGVVSQDDVQRILDIVNSGRTPTAHELRADPNQDGALTIDDAARLLKELPTT